MVMVIICYFSAYTVLFDVVYSMLPKKIL